MYYCLMEDVLKITFIHTMINIHRVGEIIISIILYIRTMQKAWDSFLRRNRDTK